MSNLLNEIKSFMNIHQTFYFLVLGLLASDYSLGHLDEKFASSLCEVHQPLKVDQNAHSDQDKQMEMLLVNHKLVVTPLVPSSDSIDVAENLVDHSEK